MPYTQEDIAYLQKTAATSTSRHVKSLAGLVSKDAPYQELFRHGMPYLPQIRDKETGKVDLDKLKGFKPEVVEYFHVLSELPSLPEALKDAATDFAAYADGEVVQQDGYYFSLDPEAELKKAGL